MDDIADNYYSLGEDWRVDKCCRGHDHCPVKVKCCDILIFRYCDIVVLIGVSPGKASSTAVWSHQHFPLHQVPLRLRPQLLQLPQKGWRKGRPENRNALLQHNRDTVYGGEPKTKVNGKFSNAI